MGMPQQGPQNSRAEDHRPQQENSQSYPQPPHACRFWGMVGNGYAPATLAGQLRDGPGTTLKKLADSNRDGWGFASFLNGVGGYNLLGPLVRRGRPQANDSLSHNYDQAVTELCGLRPRAVIGHIRAGSSGHTGVPDPHPFLQEGIAFAHNGDIPLDTLYNLLTRDDLHYLAYHEPEYVNGYIDSELYFLYLLKYAHAHPEFDRAEALRCAVFELGQISSGSRLNFVMTAGDTLYALRFASWDDRDPVCYYPTGGAEARRDNPPYWIVASQPVGPDSSRWGLIPPATLAVFVPGQPVRFLSISQAAANPKPPEQRRAQPAQVWPGRPNPTSTGTRIPLVVPAGGGLVAMRVVDVTGREVWSTPPERLEAGAREIAWGGRDRWGRIVPGGCYFCVVRVGEEEFNQRVVVTR